MRKEIAISELNSGLYLRDFLCREELFFAEYFASDDLRQYFGQSLHSLILRALAGMGVEGEAVHTISPIPEGAYVTGPIWIGEGVHIEPTAMIQGPAIIGPGSELRHGCYIRGDVWVGKDCVVGHATEVKSSIFFDGAKAGHFAYVGNSILGRDVNLGAGTKLANLKFRGDEVHWRLANGSRVNSGERKIGAILGDKAQTGCNAVLSPGAILYPGTFVRPNEHFLGTKF